MCAARGPCFRARARITPASVAAAAAAAQMPSDERMATRDSCEESNADTVSMMMNMIENSRMFQMQTEMMRMAFATAQGQSSPLTLP